MRAVPVKHFGRTLFVYLLVIVAYSGFSEFLYIDLLSLTRKIPLIRTLSTCLQPELKGMV